MANERKLSSWHERGACYRADAFISDLFTNHERKIPTPDPKCVELCNKCEVREDCLEWAMTKPEKDGVWGGTTPYMREQLRKNRHRVHCPGCMSVNIIKMETGWEVCIDCALSWVF